MTDRELAESAKTKNVVDMALTFTAMMRVFGKGSKERIAEKFEELFSALNSIDSRDGYEALHRSFCEWFVREIRTAEKTLKNGRVKPSQAASYGQAAKVLDIAIKVYAYYCGQPTSAVVQRLLPFLHGAVDTPILEHLKAKYPDAKVMASTIEKVDKRAYATLQELVFRNVRESFDGNILPVQYDDIMWRRLNRDSNAPNPQLNRTRRMRRAG